MDDTAARARIKIQGDGDEAVLVLRDLLLPSDAFASVIRALGPRIRCGWFDPTGVGASAPLQRDDRHALLDVWAREALEAIATFAPRAHILGLGLGAEAALVAAAQRPDRVASVVAIGLGGRPSSPAERTAYGALAALGGVVGARPFLRRAERQLFGHAFRHDASRRDEREAWMLRLAADGRRVTPTLRAAMRRGPIEPLLGSIRAPVLVVRGEDDQLCTYGEAHRAADMLPNGRFAVIHHAGRAAPLEEPEAVAELIDPFLTGAASRPTYRLEAVRQVAARRRA